MTAEQPEQQKPHEGWMAEKSTNIRRYHYIVGTRALCGGLGFYTGELQPDAGNTLRHADDCAVCFKRLLRRRKEKA